MELTTNKIFTHKAKDYTSFYTDTGEPRVNIEGIVEIAGGSSIDMNVDLNSITGATTYIGKASTATSADFTATRAGADSITLSGYPSGISAFVADDIEFVRQIAADGSVTATFNRDDATFSIAANVLTIPTMVSTAGDTFVIATNVPRPTASDAGGAGGGSIVYTNMSGDFVATPTNGATTITITGLPFTLEAIHVTAGQIKKIAVTTNVVSNVPLTNVSVSGGVITLADAENFVTGDVVAVTLIGPDKAYDVSLDNQLVAVQNPEYAHTTDVETISETNLGLDGVHDTGASAAAFVDSGETYSAANVAEGFQIYNVTDGSVATVLDAHTTAHTITGTLAGGSEDDWDVSDVASIPEVKRFEISADTYKFMSIHYRLHAADEHNACIMKLYASNDADADVDSDDYWVDVTNDTFGAATLEADGIDDGAEATLEGIGFITAPQICLKYMIKIVVECDNGTQDNDFDIYIKKG